MADIARNFGVLGIQDQAKYLATLYLEDISDLIVRTIDPDFGFSRYAERLGRSASTFDDLCDALESQSPVNLIDGITLQILGEKIAAFTPSLVAITIPFPGNLYSAFRCGQWLKKHHPEIKVVMGGGYVNTELRSLSDPRVFRYVDFITLDDGEGPLLDIVRLMQRMLDAGYGILDTGYWIRDRGSLTRTFVLSGGDVRFCHNNAGADIRPEETGIPDYSDLPMDKYVSVLELANRMHRLWSDGRWNKLMLAHGCYWHKCTFCDVTLDYIRRYKPAGAALLCDRMEAIISQTGRRGFHFTDESAPPSLLRELSHEIIRRNLTVTWWTNIRFEKTFTEDLCQLMKHAGCIAVSGGLEVASDRILAMINKGVTVPQVAKTAANFTRAGIMVHAYLMYGFPTQTAQETIDSLEVVRQLFKAGIVQSGFWHLFAMTAHSPVGLDPNRFGVEKEDTPPGSFANNDLVMIDRKGCNHAQFSGGLKKALYNYMHGICFDFPLQEWFDFKVPKTKVAPDYIRQAVRDSR
jgi:radical SAM superfamily enzyme YgiQ (UPF0313 family)